MDAQLEQEISAMIIQKLWKKYCYQKAIRQTVKSLREPIIIYYTSINKNQKIHTDTSKLFHLLNNRRIDYYKFDLVDNPMAQSWVKDVLNKHQLPFIKINDIFIGGYHEFETIYEGGLLQQIVKKQYLKQCILCQDPREEREVCPKCNKDYMFFELKPQKDI